MVKKKIIKEEEKPPICPHCGEIITHISWRPFANGQILLICHTVCMKVIGIK